MFCIFFQTFGDVQCILYVCLFHSDSHLNSGWEFKGSLFYELSVPSSFSFLLFFSPKLILRMTWTQKLHLSWNQRVFSHVVYLSPPNALRAVQRIYVNKPSDLRPLKRTQKWTILKPPPFSFLRNIMQWFSIKAILLIKFKGHLDNKFLCSWIVLCVCSAVSNLCVRVMYMCMRIRT